MKMLGASDNETTLKYQVTDEDITWREYDGSCNVVTATGKQKSWRPIQMASFHPFHLISVILTTAKQFTILEVQTVYQEYTSMSILFS